MNVFPFLYFLCEFGIVKADTGINPRINPRIFGTEKVQIYYKNVTLSATYLYHWWIILVLVKKGIKSFLDETKKIIQILQILLNKWGFFWYSYHDHDTTIPGFRDRDNPGIQH